MFVNNGNPVIKVGCNSWEDVYSLISYSNESFNTYILSIFLYRLITGRDPRFPSNSSNGIHMACLLNSKIELPEKYLNDWKYECLVELFYYLNGNNGGRGFDINSFLKDPLIKLFI